MDGDSIKKKILDAPLPGLLGWCQSWNATLLASCVYSALGLGFALGCNLYRGLLNDRIIQLHTSPQLEKGCLDSNWP